jgi:hypothetical protein
MSILLGCSTVSTTTMDSIDNLGRQLIRVDNIYITLINNNRVHDLITWPRQMLHFTMATAIPRPPCLTSHQAAGARNNIGLNNCYFYGYIGNLFYCLEFVPTHIRESITIADPVNGQLHAYMKATLPGQASPPNDVNAWTVCRHKDAPIGEEGSDVTRLMIGPTPRPKTWAKRPDWAQSRPDVNSTMSTAVWVL